MTHTIKLGIIGLSSGNGHPYSWSAIFNGYDPNAMKSCGFSIIPEYLSRQKFPEDSIKEAKVTHIWTQERKISEHVAKATQIPYIVNELEELVGKVEAVLLARDDYENHFRMAQPFINSLMPIFIDKPIEVTLDNAKRIFDIERYKGQIFTCLFATKGTD